MLNLVVRVVRACYYRLANTGVPTALFPERKGVRSSRSRSTIECRMPFFLQLLIIITYVIAYIAIGFIYACSMHKQFITVTSELLVVGGGVVASAP